MNITQFSSLRSLQRLANVGVRSHFLHTSPALNAKRWKEKTRAEFTSEFGNPVRAVSGPGVMAAPPPDTGHVYDNKPQAVTVREGCSYTWCGCGLARTEQPFCDLTCQNLYMQRVIKGGPVHYIAPETKEVWFCNCKQTSHRPFCDGTHRTEEIQTLRLETNRQLWEPRAKRKQKKIHE